MVVEHVIVGLLCLSVCYAATPVGHLQPFGFHRPAGSFVKEFTLDNAPTPLEFSNNFVLPKNAAVFRGNLANEPELKHWTNDYIKSNYGELEVRLRALNESLPDPLGETHYGRDTIRHFVDNMPSSNSYVVSELPQQMYKEFPVIPTLVTCGGFPKHFAEVDIWWNGGGGTSLLHEDSFHQLSCQMIGEKQWKMVEPGYEDLVYEQVEDESEGGTDGGASEIDPLSVDLIKYPNISKVSWSNITMHPGDCLFIPRGYFHQVNSGRGNNLAVAIQFGEFGDDKSAVDFADCTGDIDMKTPKLLSEFDVMWKWNGSGYMNFGMPDLEHIRAEALKTVIECDKDCSLSTFERVCNNEQQHNWYRNCTTIFKTFDSDLDGKLTTKEVENATWEQLRVYGHEVSEFLEVNSVLFECTIISLREVKKLLKQEIGKYDYLTRKRWVTKYQRILAGSKFYGERIFTQLVGSEKTDKVRSKDIT
uniref:JmjC domain-containing protein n=1 Tax=Ciona savignyi TaxID=51511 RepID=H2YDW0_CIOSA